MGRGRKDHGGQSGLERSISTEALPDLVFPTQLLFPNRRLRAVFEKAFLPGEQRWGETVLPPARQRHRISTQPRSPLQLKQLSLRGKFSQRLNSSNQVLLRNTFEFTQKSLILGAVGCLVGRDESLCGTNSWRQLSSFALWKRKSRWPEVVPVSLTPVSSKYFCLCWSNQGNRNCSFFQKQI